MLDASTNLKLSSDEQLLVENPGWILTKRGIIEKAVLLLSDVCERMKQIIAEEKTGLPPAVRLSEPKISKGENYRMLPYVLLDYPRCFDRENIFAVRTLFWWGNFFSITLHLSGNYKKEFGSQLLKDYEQLISGEYYICVNDDQWQHHFETGNYLPLSGLSADEIKRILQQQSFIKIARKFPLGEWNEITEKLVKAFVELTKPLSKAPSYPFPEGEDTPS